MYFMRCQDNCGIQTGPDPFFSLPNDKEKKSLGMWDSTLTTTTHYLTQKSTWFRKWATANASNQSKYILIDHNTIHISTRSCKKNKEPNMHCHNIKIAGREFKKFVKYMYCTVNIQ